VERIRGHDAGELLSMALDWLPASVATRLGFVHFFMGDPVFAGLHEFEVADDGVPPDRCPDVSECCQSRRPRSARRATIVLPFGPGRTATVVHELGHALDEVLGYEWLAKPVSKYARVDPFEAFAEGFTAWWDSPATRPSATGSIGLTVTQPRSSMPSPCRCSSAMGDLT
jgi:hypothetical protein